MQGHNTRQMEGVEVKLNGNPPVVQQPQNARDIQHQHAEGRDDAPKSTKKKLLVSSVASIAFLLLVGGVMASRFSAGTRSAVSASAVSSPNVNCDKERLTLRRRRILQDEIPSDESFGSDAGSSMRTMKVDEDGPKDVINDGRSLVPRRREQSEASKSAKSGADGSSSSLRSRSSGKSGKIDSSSGKSGKGSKSSKSSKGTKSTSKGAKSGVGRSDMGAGTKDGVKCAIMHDNSSKSSSSSSKSGKTAKRSKTTKSSKSTKTIKTSKSSKSTRAPTRAEVTAVDDSATAIIGGPPISIDVLANDSTSPLGRPLIINEITANAEFGTCSIDADDNTMMLYGPPTDFDLVDQTVTCDYEACTNDGAEQVCDTARLSIVLEGAEVPVTLVTLNDCIDDFVCLQNSDFEDEDPNGFDIDFNLQVTDPDTADAYLKARAKWMQIITGDLPSRLGADIPVIDTDFVPCSNDAPTSIDDLYICGKDAVLEERVLGSAGPLWTRIDPVTGKVTTITGRMTFNIDRVPGMVADGSWESVILHEMGHVLGVGTLWRTNGLINDNLDYSGVNAINVWKNDWNCASSAPPVEKDGGTGTRGGHWDEECLDNELMTGESNGGNPASVLTIASLEDIGYAVDYSAADEYDGTNTNCCNAPGANIVSPAPGSGTPPLSDAGSAAAVAYGKKILEESQRPANPVEDEDVDNGLIYVGDKIIVVVVEEEGRIYDVMVTNDE